MADNNQQQENQQQGDQAPTTPKVCPTLNRPCIEGECTQWVKLNVITVNKLGVPIPEERPMCMTTALLQCLMSVQGAIQVLGSRLGAGQQQQPMISFKPGQSPRKN